MPVGIINVYHEPPTFNGVDRPEVDTLIIPSTWPEPGIGLFGELTTGLSYPLFLVDGFTARAEFAMLFIGDTAALNAELAMAMPPPSLPVASRSQGGYVEAGYDLLRLIAAATDQSVTLFGRYDYVNTQAAVAAGLTPA